MSRLVKALILGALIALSGVLLSLAPFALRLEEYVGLDLLFGLRGVRQPPPDVVVIAIDKASADQLQLPIDPAKWPRSLHARLIDTLAGQGAAVIVFDMVFDQPRSPEEDQRFADAIRKARNVVLAEYLARETIPLPDKTGTPAGHLTIEQRVPPVPALADAALALGPFPVPKVPIKVSQYWTFKTDAGNTPTLPVVAFQLFALDLYDTFIRLFEQVSPYHAERLPRDRDAIIVGGHAEQVIRLVREIVQHEPLAADRMLDRLRTSPPAPLDQRQRAVLAALIHMYRGPASRYLNFYGPPRTITTVPYHEALLADSGTLLKASRLDFRGKAVFVGFVDSGQSYQKDGFYTVFSEPSGSDLSGVEIAATAFANLRDVSPIEPPPLPLYLATILLWGFAAGIVARLLPATVAPLIVIAASLLYVVAASHQFQTWGRWYPLVVPLFLQGPVAVLGGVVWGYSETHRERRNVRRALGYYLPAHVADQVVRNIGDLRSGSQLLHGTCLSTDAHQYTALAESMDPSALGALMNTYYAAIFEPVKRHGGIVQDVVGDSMLAIWATTHQDVALRNEACLAALDIAGAVDRFNQQSGTARLPTRIGLHSGQMLLGNVGAIDHYEYRAVGDIVNTASRLENLNKYLGTRIVVSKDVLDRLDGFLARELGTFLLVGKSKPVEVCELLCRRTDASTQQMTLCATFADGLAAYRNQFWKEAIERFHECLHSDAADGPSRFYLRLCEQYTETPPREPWDAVVHMDSK